VSGPRWAARLAAFAVSGLWAGAVHACAVCVTASERNRLAFFFTTIFLTLLPLGLIVAGLYWLSRHSKGLLAAEFEDRDEIVVPSPLDPRTEKTHA